MSSRDTTDDEEIAIEMQRKRRGVRTNNNPFAGARDEGDEREENFSVLRRAVEEAQYPSYHRNSAQNDEEDDDDDEKIKKKSDFKQPKPPSKARTSSSQPAVDEDEIDEYARTLGASSTFFCPVSLELLKDPVVVRTGQTYERASVEDWIQRGGRTCPATGQPLAEANESIVRMAHGIVSPLVSIMSDE